MSSQSTHSFLKRVLSLGIAFLLILTAAAGCSERPSGNTEPEGNAEQSPVSSEEIESPDETEAGNRLWVGQTFDGYTVNILGRSADWAALDFRAEELTGELVNDAVYNRNLQVENDLAVSLVYNGINDEYSQLHSALKNSVAAADGAYDIASLYAYFAVSLTLENILYNLHELTNADLSNPWYNQSFVREMTLYDQLYYVVGDLTMTATDRMMLMFFNKDLAEEYMPGLDLYTRVYEGEWTIDAFGELIRDLWTDKNGDGRKDSSDVFGYVFDTGSVPTDGFMAALGVHVADRDSDGNPVLSVYNEHVNSAYEKLTALVYENTGVGLNIGQGTLFQNGKAVFFAGLANFAVSLRDFEPAYGVQPLPKFDETQAGYHTFPQDAYNILCVPLTCQNVPATGAVMDELSCLSRESVYPAYFEDTFQKKFMRTEADSAMFDYVREGMEFNFGVVYSSAIGNPAWFFRDSVSGRKDLASAYKMQEKIYKKSLDKFLEKLQDMRG